MPYKHQVRGSSPLASTIIWVLIIEDTCENKRLAHRMKIINDVKYFVAWYFLDIYRNMAQFGRARGLGP